MLGGVAPPPRRFLVDASSLTFLSDNGFDLNTWVREGMSYMALREHTERTAQVRYSLLCSGSGVGAGLRSVQTAKRIACQTRYKQGEVTCSYGGVFGCAV